MTENVTVADYIEECKDDISLARRRIDQVKFLTILVSYVFILFIIVYLINKFFGFVGVLLSFNLYLVIVVLYSRYNQNIGELQGCIEHVVRTAADVDRAWEHDMLIRSAIIQYREFRLMHEYRGRLVHDAIEHNGALTQNFNTEYNGKCPNMPMYECPVCNAKLSYFGFYLRNRRTWKGSLRDLENEWLKYDRNNPKNNCSVQLLCCSCHAKIEQDQKIHDLENKFWPELEAEEQAFYSRQVTILPVRNALDLDGTLVDLDNYYGDDYKRE